jgi:hypothetical protein
MTLMVFLFGLILLFVFYALTACVGFLYAISCIAYHLPHRVQAQQANQGTPPEGS